MKIGPRTIGPDEPPYVIAELGVNHDGELERAFALVDAAAQAGADAVKLQLFEAERLVSSAARPAAYQRQAGATDSMKLLRGLELPARSIALVADRAHACGLDAIATVFSVELVEAVLDMPLDAHKTASTDLVHRPLIEALVATGRPLILSTGAATLEEVAETAGWVDGHPHAFMHCVSRYPTPDDDAALGGRLALAAVTPHALGYSDHTTSLDAGAFAVAGGASLLEKHLTLDRRAEGPDHAASLDPAGLATYVQAARRAWRMRGPVRKRLTPEEIDVRLASRQSVTTRRALAAGHVLGPDDLTIKRPGTGLAPARLAEVEGRRLARAVAADTPLTEADLT